MQARLLFLLKYFIFWVFYFLIAKAIFLLYHHSATSVLDFETIFNIFLNGVRLDISFASYICLFPFVAIGISVFTSTNFTKYLLYSFTSVAILLVSWLIVLDLELYRTWHFRIDVTPLMYINSPQEMLASASASPLILLCIILFLVIIISLAAYSLVITPQIERFNGVSKNLFVKSLAAFLFVALAGSLAIPIRGGLQLAPINQSSVYFSSNDFANHAAINPIWNFFNSWVNKTYEKNNPYNYFASNEALQKLQVLYPAPASLPPAQHLLKTDKPNIIVIIWESLTAKVVEDLGGMPGITPQLHTLSREGILFNNLYASGNRSDKGIVAILSAYPAQPKNSIITIPNKTAHLPYLSADLKKNGYHTAFYYGGELEFANIKSYLLKGSFEKVVGKQAFNPQDWNSKWGAHDHVVFNKLLADLKTTPQPFFHTMFTLSSHEPFEVPVKTAIAGKDEQSLFLNAMHYTDESLGNFIASAKKQSWWDNTLVVILADHGHRLPEINTDDKSKEFHIPMIWLGGALKQGGIIIDRLSSQTDLAPTLLSQLNIPYPNYKWGRDIFHPAARPFAYFAFNDGFGLIQPGKQVVFDNVGKRVIMQTGDNREEDIAFGKSYLQVSYQDYLDK